MKHCKTLIEPIAESKDEKKCTKTDKKEVPVEKKEERNPDIEMMMRRRWTKKVSILVMRCFYQSDPTRKQ